jgi:hypothetical protein
MDQVAPTPLFLGGDVASAAGFISEGTEQPNRGGPAIFVT